MVEGTYHLESKRSQVAYKFNLAIFLVIGKCKLLINFYPFLICMLFLPSMYASILIRPKPLVENESKGKLNRLFILLLL